MSWQTTTGYLVTVGRVDRRIIDARRREPPRPPTIRVEAWGEAEGELVPDYRDPGYLAEMRTFHLELLDGQLDMIAGVIEYSPPVEEGWADELVELGTFNEPTEANALRFEVLADSADASRAVEEVLYNSTVTRRGLDEAVARYGVTWRSGRISLDARGGDVKAYPEFEHRRAAINAHYAWDAFCALPGPEQSAIVAHYKLEAKIEWTASQKSKT